MVAAAALWGRISGTTVSDAQIAVAMERATILFQNAKYKEALAQFWLIDIPECFPNRLAQKYHNIGLTQLKLGKPAEAEEAFRQAVSYDPKDLDAYYLLICIAYEAKQYSKALDYLREAQSRALDGGDLPERFELLKVKLERSGDVR